MYIKYRNEYEFSHFIEIVHTEANLFRSSFVQNLDSCK